jgi:speckle-type POZ protein
MGSSHETTQSVHSDAPTASATHEFIIRNYSRTKGIGIGQAIRSANFTVDDREWNIEFYPDGYSFFDWRDPALFAQTVRMPARPLQAAIKFQLIDGGGKVVYGVNCAVSTFDYNSYSWGLRRFMSRKRLEGAELGALHDDCITVRCTVSVLKPEARVALLGHVEVPVPPSCFAENAARFLASGRAPFDVKFNVDGVVLEAHRLVLASRSPWFDRLLYGHWSSSDDRVVEIRGTSSEVFKAATTTSCRTGRPRARRRRGSSSWQPICTFWRG